MSASWRLGYRPASYWHVPEAILANVKGEHRRQPIRIAIATGNFGNLPAKVLADDLPVELRRLLGALQPSLMGGEYLRTQMSTKWRLPALRCRRQSRAT